MGREGPPEGADKTEMLQAGIRMMPRLMRSVPELRRLPAVGEKPTYSKGKAASLVSTQSGTLSSDSERIQAENLHIGPFWRSVNA